MPAVRIDSVRARLTLFWVAALATSLVVIVGLVYVLLARVLYSGIDDALRGVVQIATTSLANDLAEGQDYEDAARSTAAELSSPQQTLAIYSVNGQLLAEGGRHGLIDLMPSVSAAPSPDVTFRTVAERDDNDDRHRLAVRRVTVGTTGVSYIVVAAIALEPTDEELASLRTVLAYVIPIALMLAGAGGWFLAQQSLGPVAAMAARARRIGAADLSARLPVANPRDELGLLAATFNDLLARLEASLVQQRQFMADASHELRTPVATSRTAAAVALQQPHRPETDYRESLAIIEEQTARLSRIVEDMFTLARADAGSYPVRPTAMYLDEVVEEVIRGARVLATTKQVTIEWKPHPSAAFSGDEDLIRRLVGNLIDNAVRHSPPMSVVRVELSQDAAAYLLSVEDTGEGISPDIQPHVFERFVRGDAARTPAAGGAGLGLALARWIARAHGGDLKLVHSSRDGTLFTAVLPSEA
jgi:two-component system, OmpR family, sensor kinase